MLRRIFFASCFFFLFGTGYSQVPDVTVILHQNMLNAFMSPVGQVSGKGDYTVVGGKGQYTSTLSNARFELKPGQAQFNAGANVKAEFEIYIRIFGNKVHLASVDAANFHRPEFEFAGPKPIQASVDVKLPDGGVKTIYIQQVSRDLKLEDHQGVVSSRLAFSDRPPQDTGESR